MQNPAAVNLVIFDFDGVLADTGAAVLEQAAAVCEALGFSRRPTLADLAALHPMEFPQLGRQLRLPEDRISAFTRDLLEQLACLEPPPPLFTGMDAVLRSVEERGDRAAVVTGNTARLVHRVLGVGAPGCTVAPVLGIEHPGSKAERAAAVIQRVGVPRERCCLVGDATSDVAAALENRITAVGVTWGNQDAPTLRAAGARAVVDSPRALADLLAGLS